MTCFLLDSLPSNKIFKVHKKLVRLSLIVIAKGLFVSSQSVLDFLGISMIIAEKEGGGWTRDK